jgi:predicted RNase H-like HicB family nuclease
MDACPILIDVFRCSLSFLDMKLKVIIHRAEEGGFWAEVPAIPGCVSQGETKEALRENVLEAIEGCLDVEFDSDISDENSEVIELAV